MKNKKKLTIITGPAGVGKSTISNILAEQSKKSALIEGDDIYHLVKGGYISAWNDNNHLEVFWQNVISLIENFLNKDYEVIFNYIVNKDNIKMLKERFKDVEIKYVVLLTDEKTIIERDKSRPLENQMHERVIILLNSFKNQNINDKYILDTSNLSINDTVKEIDNKRFIYK